MNVLIRDKISFVGVGHLMRGGRDLFVGAELLPLSLSYSLSLSLFSLVFYLSLFLPFFFSLSLVLFLSLSLSLSLSLFLSLSVSLFSSFPPPLFLSLSILSVLLCFFISLSLFLCITLHIKLLAKLLDDFLRRNKKNINQSFFIYLALCRCFPVSHTRIVTHNLTYSRMCVCACVRILKKTSCDWRVTSKMPGFIWRAVRSKCARSLTSYISLSLYTHTLYTHTRPHTGTGSLLPVCLTNTYTGDLGETRAQGALLHTYLNTLNEIKKENLPSLCVSLAHTHAGDITGELGAYKLSL